jgi:ketosteroid isomerase-like protein
MVLILFGICSLTHAQNATGKRYSVVTPLRALGAGEELQSVAERFYKSMLQGNWDSVKQTLSAAAYSKYGGIELSKHWIVLAAQKETTGIEINSGMSVQYEGTPGFLLVIDLVRNEISEAGESMQGEATALNVWYKTDGGWKVVFLNDLPQRC